MFSQYLFGERLKALRKSRNLTLQQVGDVVSSTKSTIGNLEHGRKKPSIDIVIALADFFEVSTDYLLGLTDDPRRR